MLESPPRERYEASNDPRWSTLVVVRGTLQGSAPILIYRVDDYAAAVAQLRAAGVLELHELEIPHGPCASFRALGGQRLAVYELVRPHADEHFAGRIDP